jgi:hypothetical protein
VKKVADDAVAAKRAAMDKEVVDAAVEENDAADAAAADGATLEAASQGVVKSSPTPAIGAKRVAVSGGSTPPAKHQFRGSWKPRYVVGHCICPFPYVYFVSLGFFAVQCVSLQQDSYPLELIRCLAVLWGTALGSLRERRHSPAGPDPRWGCCGQCYDC